MREELLWIEGKGRKRLGVGGGYRGKITWGHIAKLIKTAPITIPISNLRKDYSSLLRPVSMIKTNVITSRWIRNPPPRPHFVPSLSPAHSSSQPNSWLQSDSVRLVNDEFGWNPTHQVVIV